LHALAIALVILCAARAAAQNATPEAKRANLEATRARAIAAGDLRQAGWIDHEIGWQAYGNSEPAEAARAWDRGIAEMDRADDIRGRLTLVLAKTFVESGRAKAALVADGLAAARALGDAWLEGGFLHRKGEDEVFEGRYADAVETLTASIACFERTDR